MSVAAIRKPGKGGGGGYLNGVSGALVDYTFKVEGEGTTKKGDSWTRYSVELNVQPDGGDVKPQFFKAGFLYGNNAISKDGKSIVGTDAYYVDGGEPWGEFLVSLTEGEGDRVPEDLLGDCRNFEAVMGTRVTFSRLQDVEATIAAGQRKLGVKTVTAENRDTVIAAGKRKGKGDNADKSFMLDKLLVAEVLALPEVKATKGGKKAVAAKAAPKATPKAAAATVDTDAADAALKAILEGVDGGTLDRAKINGALIRYRLANKATISADQGEALRKVLVSDDYINGAAEREVIVIDGSTITLIPEAVAA